MSAECSIIERHKILKIVLNCSKLFQICSKFQIRVYLSVYGVGPVFWVWTGLLPDLTQNINQNFIIYTIINHKPTDHIILCVPAASSRLRELWFIISLSIPWVCLLSFQCVRWARSVPACQEMSQMSWSPRHCATVPDGKKLQDCTYGLVNLFVMMISVCFTLSCDGLLAVFVTIYCFKSTCSLSIV